MLASCVRIEKRNRSFVAFLFAESARLSVFDFAEIHLQMFYKWIIITSRLSHLVSPIFEGSFKEGSQSLV